MIFELTRETTKLDLVFVKRIIGLLKDMWGEWEDGLCSWSVREMRSLHKWIGNDSALFTTVSNLVYCKLKMGRVFSMFPSRSNVSRRRDTHNLLLLSCLSSTFVIWTSMKERDSVSSKPRVCLLPSKIEYCLLAEEDPWTLLVWCKPVEITVSTQAGPSPAPLESQAAETECKTCADSPTVYSWVPIKMCRSIC